MNNDKKKDSVLRDAQDAVSAAEDKEELVEEAEKEELTLEADEEIEEIEDEENAKDQVSDEFKNLEAQLRRAVADYQNLEKRTQENKKDWILSANKDLILRLLPGLDNLLLADFHTNDEGVKIAIKHFMDILEQEGVKKIKTEGAEFDPNLMEAVTTAEGDEGIVVQEVKAGYTLNENVLRVAQVIVGSGKQSN